MTPPVGSPFDPGTDRGFHVLVNARGQHSLWPAFVPVPAGWTQVYSSASRDDCLSYITEHWVDLAPATDDEDR